MLQMSQRRAVWIREDSGSRRWGACEVLCGEFAYSHFCELVVVLGVIHDYDCVAAECIFNCHFSCVQFLCIDEMDRDEGVYESILLSYDV